MLDSSRCSSPSSLEALQIPKHATQSEAQKEQEREARAREREVEEATFC